MSLRTDRKQVFSRDRMMYRMPAYIRFLPSEDAGISSDCGWNSDYFLYKNLENLYKFSEFLYKIFSDITVFFEKYGRFDHFCQEMAKRIFFYEIDVSMSYILEFPYWNRNVSSMLVTYLGYLVPDLARLV